MITTTAQGFTDFPENHLTYTDNPLTEARLRAIQGVYQVVEMNLPQESVLQQFLLGQMKQVALDTKLFSELLKGVCDDHVYLMEIIKPSLKEGWPWERMASVLRCLLLCAAYELTSRGQSPYKVVISEYVTLAKAFVPDNEANFVNALLDTLAKRLRPDEQTPTK